MDLCMGVSLGCGHSTSRAGHEADGSPRRPSTRGLQSSRRTVRGCCGAVAVAILRHFAAEWARWGQVDDLHYWRSSSGREVDFVIEHDRRFHGIEVKSQATISGWDELSLTRGIGGGVLVTRDTFEFAAIPRIPLWAFLLLRL